MLLIDTNIVRGHFELLTVLMTISSNTTNTSTTELRVGVCKKFHMMTGFLNELLKQDYTAPGTFAQNY